jgi:hypothetical protein
VRAAAVKDLAHALAVVTILVTGSPARAKKPADPPTCEKSSDRLSKRQADWEAYTSKSFAAALARAQLTIPKMSARTLPAQHALLKGVRPGTTFTLVGDTAVFMRTVQGYAAPSDEFVEDAQGVIHPLVRKEHLVGTEPHALCGCGPMAGGGTPPPTVAIVYVLPPSTTYDATPIEVAYDAKHVQISWRNVVGGKDVRCAPRP